MCHSLGRGLLFAILAGMSILDCAAAGAQIGPIEQNFAAMPRENLAAAGVAGQYATVGAGRPIKITRD